MRGSAMIEACYGIKPLNTIEGIHCFGNERDGDYFDEDDVLAWRDGCFQNAIDDSKLFDNNATRQMLYQLSKETNVIDLASGPGMGLIPSLLRINPSIPCMISDANLSLLREWKIFLTEKPAFSNIDFAQFSLMDIPFKDNSVSAYSSFIGLGSTRSGLAGYDHVVTEVFRTLKPGGKLFTVEVDWTNIPDIIDLFHKMNQQPWDIFSESMETGNRTWRDRFTDIGFRILYQELFEHRNLKESDNELGKAAKKYGVEVGMDFNAFIVQKL